MQKVLTAEQMREVDRETTARFGIPSILLMENAAHAVARTVAKCLAGEVRGRSVTILCGKGNNGGDGAALARILSIGGAYVDVYLLGNVDDTTGDAFVNFDILRKLSTKTDCGPRLSLHEVLSTDFDENVFNLNADVIVDAVFGTGLTRPVSPFISDLFGFLKNKRTSAARSQSYISIDVPSGVNADHESDYNDAFEADHTVTFTAPKRANILPPNSNRNGELTVARIGSPAELVDKCQTQLEISERSDAVKLLSKLDFSDDSYKQKRGHSLIIAGSDRYSGAAVLASNAAMRSGVGLVTLVTPLSAKDSVSARILPEVMARSVAETEIGTVSEHAYPQIEDLLEMADAIAIGSGLAQHDSTEKFVIELLEKRRQAVVVDADALNMLSTSSDRESIDRAFVGSKDLAPLILTPHEGEFMRLLRTDDKRALTDRVAAVRDFSSRYNVILVLKGERVLIGDPSGRVIVNPTGNSGLGKAGNGDTLTGILAGLLAQANRFKADIVETVVAAVYVAGLAGDVAEKKYGKRVMTASDVRESLAEVFKELAL